MEGLNMALTLKQVEAIPTSYPDVTPYPHRNAGDYAPLEEDAVIEGALVWQRLEAWIAHRWGARQVVWTVEGEGDWTPPLTPATLTTSEKWESGAWVSVTLPDGPFGYCLPSDGPYRITATVGSTETPPETVQEAWRRLHEYSRGVAEQWRNDGAENEGQVSQYNAKSLQLSGAADLLRPYRRA
jgi:hypothetical protein